MVWERSHHTVAFCFLINATYEVGLFVATDLFDVDRLGMLALEFDPVVPCRCILAGDWDVGREDTEGVETEGVTEFLWLSSFFVVRGLEGRVEDEMVLE